MEKFGTSFYNKMIRNEKKIGDYIVTPVMIGSGSFSEVYSGYRLSDKKEVAVKVVDLKIHGKLYEKLEQEISIHGKLIHPNIVKLEYVGKSDRYLYMVMEKCNIEGKKWFIRKKPLEDKQIRKFMIELVEGIKYLYSQGVVHRDLKLGNLLITDDNLEGKGVIKIADFGFAIQMKLQTDLTNTICGSPLYMAPEIFNQDSYGHQIDLWSLGVILYELSYGKPPFLALSKDDLVKKMNHSEVYYRPGPHEEGLDLMRKLLQKDPKNRLSYEDLFRHPYLSLDNSSGSFSPKVLELDESHLLFDCTPFEKEPDSSQEGSTHDTVMVTKPIPIKKTGQSFHSRGQSMSPISRPIKSLGSPSSFKVGSSEVEYIEDHFKPG